MELEDRLTRLKGDILAIKRDLATPDQPGAKIPSNTGESVAISYKLDTLISQYLKIKDKILLLQEQNRPS